MKKFDYIEWVTKNKYGLLNEVEECGWKKCPCEAGGVQSWYMCKTMTVGADCDCCDTMSNMCTCTDKAAIPSDIEIKDYPVKGCPPRDTKPKSPKKLREQINPFSGGGSGPNWQAAATAWDNWNATTQQGAPQADQIFLNNMQGKGCNFYQARLTAQINDFINRFGHTFASAGSSNPAWQSKKYARIMWLANKVQTDCSGTTTGQVSCFYNWINDTSNDGVLDSAQCANGSQAITANNKANMKFRHQSISDCGMLDNKIAEFVTAIANSSGCATVRKQAKHDYLVNLKNHCC